MGDFRLGRVLGFEVRINWSWLIIFLLVLWTFTASVFPLAQPALGWSAYAAMGLAATLLFFTSILAHELSHAVVARASGIEVHSITLFIFGGIARTERDADAPGREFLIAAVGPLMSFFLGAAFWAVAVAAAGAGAWGGAVSAVARQLAYVNVLLAVFNLVPGFPLDGGRLFRAVAWKVTGNLTRATRIATALGRGFGYVLVALGLWQTLRGNPVGGLWLVFIGWFLASAATASMEDHVIRSALARARARDVMTRDPEVVPETMPLERLAAEFLVRPRYRAFPVVTDGGLAAGIVGIADLRRVPREQWRWRTVRDVMTDARAVAVDPDEDVGRALDRIRGAPVRRALVVRDGRVVGIVTPSDVALWVERRREMDEMGGQAVGSREAYAG